MKGDNSPTTTFLRMHLVLEPSVHEKQWQASSGRSLQSLEITRITANFSVSWVLGCGLHNDPMNEVGTAVPVPQMRELRHREVKSPAGGCTARSEPHPVENVRPRLLNPGPGQVLLQVSCFRPGHNRLMNWLEKKSHAKELPALGAGEI